MVARAGRGDPSLRRRTLETLVKQYLPALRAYLMSRRRIAADDADNLLQGFLASKVLDQQIIARAEPARGKFRTFLMTALERYAISEHRKASATRRSPAGGQQIGSLDAVEDGHHPIAPEAADVFDVEWAKQAVDVAVGRMRRECESGGRLDLWGVFKARVLDPALSGAEPVSYEDLVPGLSLASAQQAGNLLTTAKRMFMRNLREVVSEYAEDDEDVDAEVGRLKRILSGPGA